MFTMSKIQKTFWFFQDDLPYFGLDESSKDSNLFRGNYVHLGLNDSLCRVRPLDDSELRLILEMSQHLTSVHNRPMHFYNNEIGAFSILKKEDITKISFLKNLEIDDISVKLSNSLIYVPIEKSKKELLKGIPDHNDIVKIYYSILGNLAIIESTEEMSLLDVYSIGSFILKNHKYHSIKIRTSHEVYSISSKEMTIHNK